ncbi:MAG: hypothetical protein H0X25_15165 [Acidobacteriales bacterium]|nr:hypothetical protein [Terriglobales bacterium]
MKESHSIQRATQAPIQGSCPKAEPSTGIAGLLEVAQEIAAERLAVLDKMRSALERGAETEALSFARQLCGLGEEHHGARVN